MRILFVCNTYMQVIIAVQMKLKLYCNDDVDIIISDDSVGADKVAAGLEKAGIFSKVKYVETKAMGEQQHNFSAWQRVSEVLEIFAERSSYNKLLWDDDFIYDEICYYNPTKIVYVAYSHCLRMRKNVRIKEIPICNIFEEGIFSYKHTVNDIVDIRKHFHNYGGLRLFHMLNKLFGRKDILRSTKKFTCFYPEIIDNQEFYKKEGFSFTKLPKIKADPDFLRILNTAFNYDPSTASFPQKYIYLATSADYDGYQIGETELVLKLADLVGKDNLLVKMHTRDRRTVYKDNGLNVMPNSSTPWEVMQLNHDFSDHVFVSLSSGSIVNMMAMTNESIPAYFLYPMVKGKNEWIDNYSQTISSTLAKLQALGICKSIRSIDNLQEILNA